MSKYASGKYALSLCDKCGLTFRYLNIKSEAGTGFRVCSGCDDGQYNLFDHPQNHVGDAFRRPEAINLRYPRPDVPLAVGWEAEDTFQQIPVEPGGSNDT